MHEQQGRFARFARDRARAGGRGRSARRWRALRWAAWSGSFQAGEPGADGVFGRGFPAEHEVVVAGDHGRACDVRDAGGRLAGLVEHDAVAGTAVLVVEADQRWRTAAEQVGGHARRNRGGLDGRDQRAVADRFGDALAGADVAGAAVVGGVPVVLGFVDAVGAVPAGEHLPLTGEVRAVDGQVRLRIDDAVTHVGRAGRRSVERAAAFGVDQRVALGAVREGVVEAAVGVADQHEFGHVALVAASPGRGDASGVHARGERALAPRHEVHCGLTGFGPDAAQRVGDGLRPLVVVALGVGEVDGEHPVAGAGQVLHQAGARAAQHAAGARAAGRRVAVLAVDVVVGAHHQQHGLAGVALPAGRAVEQELANRAVARCRTGSRLRRSGSGGRRPGSGRSASSGRCRPSARRCPSRG